MPLCGFNLFVDQSDVFHSVFTLARFKCSKAFSTCRSKVRNIRSTTITSATSLPSLSRLPVDDELRTTRRTS